MLVKALHRALCVALPAALTLGPSAGLAAPPEDGIDVQLFRPGGGASDYLHLQGGFLGRHTGLSFGAVFDHATGVLLTSRKGRGDKEDILETQQTVNLMGSFGLWERLELGVAVPLVVNQSVGAGWSQVAGGAPEPSSFAMGDVRITPKIKLIDAGYNFALSIAAPMSLPTGQGYAGYGSFSVEPKLLVDWSPAYYFRLTANVGYRWREEASHSGLTLGEEITWALGMKMSFFLGDQLFSLLTSFAGSFELPDQPQEDPPFEFLGGLEWRGIKDLAVYAAAGAGLTRGYGSPDFRAVAGIRIGGYRDCPYGEEDFDGFEDEDGCADPDNDQDGIPDSLDVCPNEPETKNGYEDDDGCPDEVLSFASKLDGSEDPSATTRDSDHDGVPDAYDHCPFEAEDFDGFEDQDGCPEDDNDKDGIPDSRDQCPNLAEVINGFEDDDGCPDVPKGPVRIDDLTRQITITDKIYFDTGKATIQKRSFELLDAIADLLKARTDIAKLLIEGHTDDVGSAEVNRRLSGERAASVVKYLVEKGIEESRLSSVGIGKERPIATNRTAAGRAENRRVEFQILEYRDNGTSAPLEVPLEPEATFAE